jgi:hypothetical protein
MLFKKRPSWISQDLWLRLMRQRDRRKHLRRQVIRFFKHPKLAIAYFGYRRAVGEADWLQVKKRVLALSKLAVQARDRRTTIDMIAALERVGCYRESSTLWFSDAAGNSKSLPNEWRGEDLSGKTLLINLSQDTGQGLGIGYRCAHIVAKLIGRARRTIVVVEPRLIPTYRRTFPTLEFTSPKEVSKQDIDYVALPAYLLVKFDFEQSAAQNGFQPLLSDREKTARLRKKYLATQNGGRKPLIGLCWYSSHHGKDLPALQDWRGLIDRTDATFVSLQYGNVAEDLKVLSSRVIVDDSIDQLVDMDGFAAQVAALDGSITIINTLANLGGALAVPTIVLRDDWFRRNQPVLSDQMPWYPSVRIVGKNRRDWVPVLDESFAKLRALISERSPTARFD